MTTPTVTVPEILSWEPCVPWPERIPEIAKGCSRRKRWSALHVIACCKRAEVPAVDVLWLVLRPELIAETDLHELACRFAHRALRQERKAGREPDRRSWEAIRVKRRWLRGKASDEDLAAAKDAAWTATWTARDAAWAAARTAARAARDAARDAAWDAARDAEYRWELECTVRLLRRAPKDRRI